MAFLPQYLLNGWRLEGRAQERAKKAEELKGLTVSSLAEFYVKFQLEKHYRVSGDHHHHTPTLSSIAIGKILDFLQKSESLTTDVTTVAENLSSTTLKQLLEDLRTPYQVLRGFDALSHDMAGKGRRLVDIDEAIIRNERHVRSRGLQNRDGKYLVGLADLCGLLSETVTASKPVKVMRSTESKPLEFTRKDPPKGGLEVLDYCRNRRLTINSSNASFGQVFDRITKGILRGLDWSNVMIAGGMALTTLLH